MCTQFNLAPGPRKLFWNLCKSVASRASINCRPDTSPSQCWSSLIPRCRLNLVVHMSHLRLEGRGFFDVFLCTHLNQPSLLACEIGQKSLQVKCKPRKPILSEVKVFWYRVWILGGGIYVHITKSMWGHCEDSVRNMWSGVRNMWGECLCTHLNHPLPLACEIG